MLLTNSMEAACYLPTVWRLHVTYQQYGGCMLLTNSMEAACYLPTVWRLHVTYQQYGGCMLLPTVWRLHVTYQQYEGCMLLTNSMEAACYLPTGRFVIVKNADCQLPQLGRDWLWKLHLNWPRMLSSLVCGDP